MSSRTLYRQRLVGRPLRSRTPMGVIPELYGLLLAHYAVRVLMHEAVLSAGSAAIMAT